MTRLTSRRIGFTSVELLIVVAIIGIMLAITTGAVVRVRSSQEKAATEATVSKLASELERHWSAVIESAKKDYDALPNDIKQNLMAVADNTVNSAQTPKPHPRRDDRARLIYLKLRLKQEFPTSFATALYPGSVLVAPPVAPSYLPDPAPPYYLPAAPVPLVANRLFTGKSAFVKAILGKTLAPELQSAALLALALEQSHGGTTSGSLEQLVGSTFVRNENGFRYVVDTWGRPLQFFVFTTGDALGATDLLGNDPQDPEGLLKPVAFSKWQNPIFASILHPQVTNHRLVPVIASAGPDGDIGGLVAAANPYMNLPGPGAYDNIYSFRLRQTGARGD